MGEKRITGKIVKIQPAGSMAVIAADKPVSENIISSVKVYFIEIDGKPVPFFPESAEVRGNNTILVTFADYKDVVWLRKLTGCRVTIYAGENQEEETFSLNDLAGYTFTAAGENLKGHVTGVTDNNGSIILEVLTPKGKSILVPFHEDFVTEINSEKRALTMQLPEGLTDLNAD